MPRKGVPATPKAPGENVQEPLKRVQSPTGRYGDLGVWSPSDRYLFGTATEVDARLPDRKYDLRDPGVTSPRFTAIRPGATSQSLNEPNPRTYAPKGPGYKYSRGVPK